MAIFDRGAQYPKLYYELTGPKATGTSKDSTAIAASTCSPCLLTALLIHGLTCDLTDFSLQISYLHTLGIQTLAFDTRGHGKSSLAPDNRYSPVDIAHDAKALIDHLSSKGEIPLPTITGSSEAGTDRSDVLNPDKDDRVLVIGHSIGAVAASVLATLYPSLVSGLVMIDPPFWDAQTAENIQRVYDPNNTPDSEVNSITVSSWEARAGSYAFFGPLTPAEIKNKILRRVRAHSPQSLRGSVLQSLGPDGLAVWENHRRFIQDAGGRKVKRLTVRQYPLGEKVRELGAGADNQISKLSGGGHWLHISFPEDFNGILRGWIEENGLISDRAS